MFYYKNRHHWWGLSSVRHGLSRLCALSHVILSVTVLTLERKQLRFPLPMNTRLENGRAGIPTKWVEAQSSVLHPPPLRLSGRRVHVGASLVRKESPWPWELWSVPRVYVTNKVSYGGQSCYLPARSHQMINLKAVRAVRVHLWFLISIPRSCIV